MIKQNLSQISCDVRDQEAIPVAAASSKMSAVRVKPSMMGTSVLLS